MNNVIARSGPVGVILCLAAALLAWLSLARGALVLLFAGRLQDVPDLWRVFPIGLRMDVMAVSALVAIPAMIYLLAPGRKWGAAISMTLLTLVAAVMIHLELTTPAFIAEYDLRPNRLYYEYLRYPREVTGTLLRTYPLQLTIVAAALVLQVWLFHRLARWLVAHAQPWPWRARAVAAPLLLCLFFIGARSSFDHRPANVSSASFSHNHLANELAISSTYSLANAIYNDLDEARLVSYGAMDAVEAERRVLSYRVRRSTPLAMSAPDRPPNLVILVLESVGAGFTGALGGLPLTPNFDRLAPEGTLFTQMYATGTRTVRGLEAIVTGFPPSAAQSVLKREGSQRDFFTLAALLHAQGYRTDFIYGGSSDFDEMGRFFRQNGFKRVIEQDDFVEPAFVGTWGVADEDLVHAAHEAFLAHGDHPFFALLLSTSNHPPFEFPDGRIELYDKPAATRSNAVKYTDYAVGKLFELAKSAPYWQNTLFLVVADHDSRVFGADLVPIERFRIPALLIGPGVPQAQYSKVASQIDLAPTLLGLMGVAAPDPMIGRDLFALTPQTPGRALMQYGNTNALMVDDRVVISQPHQPQRTFHYERGALQSAPADLELERDALAHLIWADLMYRERRHGWPQSAHDGLEGP